MDLDVEGLLPHDLDGRYLCVGPSGRRSRVHALELGEGQALSYRQRAVDVDDADRSGAALIEFAGRLLSLADGSPAYELGPDLSTVGSVDLAGGLRRIGAHPRLDPVSGELHLISSPGTRSPLLHIISAGGLTRRTRAVHGAPSAVRDLALTERHVVLVADGSIGVSRRDEDGGWSWYATDSTAPVTLVCANDDNVDEDGVVALATTPALERWTLHRGRSAVGRSVIDGDPQSFGRINESRTGWPPRYVYAVEDLGRSVLKHDLVTGARTSHDVRSGRRCGEFLFVADPGRSTSHDGGWLLGLVGDDSDHTDFVVLDAADLSAPAVATVRVPRRVPGGLRGLWVPTPL